MRFVILIVKNQFMKTNAHLGALVADALAMPVHWYYDREALLAEYGPVDRFLAPHAKHSGSILWRSEYSPINAKGDILHDQAQYWGREGVHYHQFLAAGENTVNFKLADLLFRQITSQGGYDPDRWLETYIDFMLTPGSHRDTYLEEYHRGFFTRYAQGKKPRKCGIRDEHIGGLAHVPTLFAALPEMPVGELRAIVKEHVSLTHLHEDVLRAADCLVCLLHHLSEGLPLREALRDQAGDWFSSKRAEGWSSEEDTVVIGKRLSPACYINESFPASLYLAWKYHQSFDLGIIANAMVGGDSCHRGAVVGALLGLSNGVPDRWRHGLQCYQPDRSGEPA